MYAFFGKKGIVARGVGKKEPHQLYAGAAFALMNIARLLEVLGGRLVSPAHSRVGPEALLRIEGEHKAFDHCLRKVLFERFPEAFGQTIADILVAFRLDEQSGHFDDDLGPKAELHHVRRKEDCHRVLAFEAKLGDTLNGFDDAFEDLIELSLAGLRKTPDFDHWHRLLSFRWL